LKCCNEDGSALDILPKECLKIKISDDNEPHSKHRCLSVPRALDTSDRGCNIKPVRQVSVCTILVNRFKYNLNFYQLVIMKLIFISKK